MEDPFKTYLAKGKTLSELARRVNVAPHYLSDLRRDQNRMPGLKLAFDLQKESGGLVRAKSFYERKLAADRSAQCQA